MERLPSAGATRLLRSAHLAVGLVFLVVFLGTGQYMDLVHDHLRGMDDVRRMLFRSVHIYLLLAALLNLALGLYLRPGAEAPARLLQILGSLPVLVAPALLLQAFFTEPQLAELARPYTRPALYSMLGGMLLHLLAVAGDRSGRRAPPAMPPGSASAERQAGASEPSPTGAGHR